jgi:hypothetical protein
MSYPKILPVPPVGWISPMSNLMVVVFPAPFGPRKPKIEVFFTFKFRFLIATVSLYVLLKLEVLITLSDLLIIPVPSFS